MSTQVASRPSPSRRRLPGPSPTSSAVPAGGLPGAWIRAVDIAVKLLLAFFLGLVVADPTWGNLEGKAPFARAILYPLPALVLPVVVGLRHRAPFPWGADLLISLTAFSDILGNRLDLYDTVAWFDDCMHLINTALLAGALVSLTTGYHSVADLVLRAVAIGMTLALGWELFEYTAFLTRSPELPTAYADTVTDLCLGWLGSVGAGVVVAIQRVRTIRDLRVETG